jgi:chromate transporter
VRCDTTPATAAATAYPRRHGPAGARGIAVNAPTEPSFRQAFRFWLRLGFINFGGPSGQIAIMHDELVERRRWIDEDRFLHALSFCMLLPGPEAQQLATYVGWLLHGLAGGIVAGVLFVLPAAVLMAGLALVYAAHGDVTWVSAVFASLSAAVVGIVAAALISIGRRAIRSQASLGVAIVVLLAIFVVGVPFPLVILAAGVAGLSLGPGWMGLPPETQSIVARAPLPPLSRTLRDAAGWLTIWLVPIVIVVVAMGSRSVFAREGLFYAQVAVVTFGGAYAVLSYVGHEVVSRFGLGAADVVAGLGLAETTPGPLILVLEFLGFLAAYRNPGTLPPAVAGTLGAAITLWATFAPSFLWIFVGAPYVERLRANRRLRGALEAITAAVVGVIASLALTVATAVLFDEVDTARPFWATIPMPRLATLDGFELVVAVAAFVSAWRYRISVVRIVVASAAAGLLWWLVR